LLRGLQEVIERDAVVGAWWGRYVIEEYAIAIILEGLRTDARERVMRRNLTYHAYRILTPFSAHVTMITLTGEDREGWCFSIGSACRETAAASWEKSLLEAIHGRHYVRYLKQQIAEGRSVLREVPTTFAEHAVWYSVYPDRLADTILGRTTVQGHTAFPPVHEDVGALVARLGPERPVLFRDMTPPALASDTLGWHVLRVFVPGLQPLHGHHHLPHLGGPLWAPRGWADYHAMPPHPFP
jgi:ribosomal protein S12 methylthiotransferase accessory factor YcaO